MRNQYSNRNNNQDRSMSSSRSNQGSRSFRDSSYDRSAYQDRDSSANNQGWRPDEDQDLDSNYRTRSSHHQSDYPTAGYQSSGSAYGVMGRDSEYSNIENRPSRRPSYDSDSYGSTQGSRGAGYNAGNQGFNYGSTTGFNSGSTYSQSAGNTYGRSQDAMTDGDHRDRNSASRWEASRSPSDRQRNYGSSSSDWGSEQGYGQSFGQYDQGSSQSFHGRGPKSFKRTDDRIKEEVCELLMRDHSVDAQDIDVEVKDGEVTLTGSVPERRMKHLAEECIEKCYGVKDITNQLRVKKEGQDSMSSEGRSSMNSSSREGSTRDSSPTSLNSGSTSSSRKSSGSASSLS